MGGHWLTMLGRARWRAAAVLLVLAGCGFPPFGPAGPRPPLPSADPFPAMAAEDAVEQLESLGFTCGFEPDSDIAGGWTCSQEEESPMRVRVDSEETGPIMGVAGGMQFPSSPFKETLDRDAAANFGKLLPLFLPADVQPTPEGLKRMVSANWPADLGSGWFLGFDHSSQHRSMRIVYSEASAGQQ